MRESLIYSFSFVHSRLSSLLSLWILLFSFFCVIQVNIFRTKFHFALWMRHWHIKTYQKDGLTTERTVRPQNRTGLWQVQFPFMYMVCVLSMTVHDPNMIHSISDVSITEWDSAVVYLHIIGTCNYWLAMSLFQKTDSGFRIPM